MARQIWAHCVVTNRLCGWATLRDLRLALHPNSDGQMHNLRVRFKVMWLCLGATSKSPLTPPFFKGGNENS